MVMLVQIADYNCQSGEDAIVGRIMCEAEICGLGVIC